MTLLKIFLFVLFVVFNFALNDLVIGRVNVLVQRCLDSLHTKRCEETVVDSILERIRVYRLAKIGVGVYVVFCVWALRSDPI